jgi:hypothetical protein
VIAPAVFCRVYKQKDEGTKSHSSIISFRLLRSNRYRAWGNLDIESTTAVRSSAIADIRRATTPLAQ